MPPFLSSLKNDGPACRVCGCTEHNACFDELTGSSCGWTKTRGVDVGPLCTACAGTADDLANAIKRSLKTGFAGGKQAIMRAALTRYEKRKKEVDAG